MVKLPLIATGGTGRATVFRSASPLILALTCCCTLGLGSRALAQPAVELQMTNTQAPRYQTTEFPLAVRAVHTNPFDPDDVEVNVRLTTPGGRQLVVPAFYGQEYERRRIGPPGRERDWIYPQGLPVWKARFAPTELGEYRAVAEVRDRTGSATSQSRVFQSRPSHSKGFVRVSRKDPRFLEFTEGQPFFALGQNLAFIGEQQHMTLGKAEAVFATLAGQGANYLRIWTCSEDWALAIEARKSAWGRSWNWRPPFAPLPGAETNRLAVRLSAERADATVNPSHTVALRPGTRYTLRGRVRTENAAVVQLEVQRARQEPIVSASSGSWLEFRREFQTGPDEYWLAPIPIRLEGAGPAWLDGLSLQESDGGPELLWEADVNRPRRGVYNLIDCFILDELVAAAEQHGIYLQLCLLTRDLYMPDLKEPESKEYQSATKDAQKFYRYAVARWGASTHVAAWEYWNEMNPALPTGPFYAALAEYLDRVDVYRHLRTTSTWGPSARDCRDPGLDIAGVHFYLRPSDRERLHDEVDAALERTRWLRENAPRKPAHLSEFGLANDRWQPRAEVRQSESLVDFHNALWASSLSGASGSALYWWWERLDQRNAYPIYGPLSTFLRDVPWNSGEIEVVSVPVKDERLRVTGLRAQNRAWLWVFNREASWEKIVVDRSAPSRIEGAVLELEGVPSGRYRVTWVDTRNGAVLDVEEQMAAGGNLRLAPPAFTQDIACRVVVVSP